MKDKHKILTTVGIFHAFNDGALDVIPLLFPILRVLFDLSYTQIGIITGGGFFITLVSQVSIGRVSDRKNFRNMLSVGIFLIGITLLLMTQIQGFLTLLILIFVLRFACSFYHPIGIGWVSRTFKKDRLDWGMGVQSAFGDFGSFIAILTTLFIAERLGWSYPFYFWSAAGFIILFSGLFLTKKIDYKYLEIHDISKGRQPFREAFSEAWLLLKLNKVLLPGFVVSGVAWSLIINYLPLLLDERTNLTLSSIGIVVSIWMGVGVIVCLLYGRIKDLLGRRNTLIFSYFIMGFMGFALSFFTNISVIVLIMFLLGVSTFLTFPAMFSYVSEITHNSVESKTFSYLLTLQLGGQTILVFAGGVLSDIYGIWIPFTILGFMGLFVGSLLVINLKKSNLSNIK